MNRGLWEGEAWVREMDEILVRNGARVSESIT